MDKADQIVDEIRNTRNTHASRFNYDLKAICADLKRLEEACGHRIVTLPPKRLLKRDSG